MGRLVLRLDCKAGATPWSDPSVPQVDRGHRLDFKNSQCEEVGDFISSVQGGDVPLKEFESGEIEMFVDVPEHLRIHFNEGTPCELYKGPHLLAACKILSVEES